MSEPLRDDPARTPSDDSGREASDVAERAARVEELLLAGLDLYFAGQFQDAITVWTRVIFLERGHGRARAYIERARSAIAEQQREGEELLHRGRAAYERGQVDEARGLLMRAVDTGVPHDDALTLLQRLNLAAPPLAAAAARPETAASPSPAATPARDAGAGWTPALLVIAALSALALVAAPLVSRLAPATAADAAAAPTEGLPIVRTGELLLERARGLAAGGHLRDALRALDRIEPGDPVHAAAGRLRGDLQRELLATVRGPAGQAGQTDQIDSPARGPEESVR